MRTVQVRLWLINRSATVTGSHIRFILGIPARVVTACKWLGVIHLDWDQDLTARPDVEAQPGVDAPVLGHDTHHRPLATAEDALECGFVGRTGVRAVTRMRMQPKSRELLGLSAEVHLLIEELAYGFIVELDTDPTDLLFDREKFRNAQQVIGLGDGKAPDFIL